MNLQELQSSNQIIFESITGSQAYGTNISTSDTDIKGVFIAPKEEFYGISSTTQISDARSDIVYYEVGRFVELMSKSNPNMLEMLAMPRECIQRQHPIFQIFKIEDILSKQCRFTFAGYAMAQIKKAHGLNKKIVNPMSKERKSVLDFCYIVKDYGAISLPKWLEDNGLKQENCGLVKIANMRDLYALFYDEAENLDYKGIISKPTANQVSLTSIEKGAQKKAILSFNKDGYSTYCKTYREYFDWVKKRNPSRYQNTIEHGKNYDAKNMMHTFRLLDMAYEIATEGVIRVRRPNRDFLLKIRSGDFEYNELLKRAEDKLAEVDAVFDTCTLPDKPNRVLLNEMLIDVRREWYG
jgi:predicted nucleotidyltransferase